MVGCQIVRCSTAQCRLVSEAAHELYASTFKTARVGGYGLLAALGQWSVAKLFAVLRWAKQGCEGASDRTRLCSLPKLRNVLSGTESAPAVPAERGAVGGEYTKCGAGTWPVAVHL